VVMYYRTFERDNPLTLLILGSYLINMQN